MWAWLKAWEVREWLTLLFASVGASIAWVRWRHDKRDASAKSSRLWSLKPAEPYVVKGSGLALRLRLENPNENRFRLVRLRGRRPWGVKLAEAKYHHEQGDGGHYRPQEFARSLTIEKDLTPAVRMGMGLQELDYSKVLVFVLLPERPFWSRRNSTRVEIEATVEEISSSRPVSLIIIKSQPIEWAASKPAKTT